jgi:glycosyltransferase involved in cell wall biosynthesis
MRLGMIVRMDATGLGNQTRELASMLNPDKLLIINSHRFNQKDQNIDWYEGYDYVINDGFLSDQTVINFLQDINVVFSCEIFYSDNLVSLARERGIKTILQYNYEFLDYYNNPTYPLPDYLLAPSVWELDRVKRDFGDRTSLVYLPPSMDHNQFKQNSENNKSKNHKKLLHIAGNQAYLDRNGTNLVIEMLKYSTADYELVMRGQSIEPIECSDPRLTIQIDGVDDHISMYNGYDAMVLPRKYGGLCLPMNEALLSSLPVFMSDVSPNNSVLPKEWLAAATLDGNFWAKSHVEYFKTDAQNLAKKIDAYMNTEDKTLHKETAFNIGYNNYSAEVLKDKYLSIIG